jgi:GTP-binding protein YchF
MSVTQSHSLSIGIVGLPNAGKSTLFNSLTQNSVPAENFPFCTIDKNVGVVEVPDERLDMLDKHFKAEKRVPSAITFVDIAGLVEGASKGEGLGNQFLSHIREVDVIMYVLRSFESEKISHVYDGINPVRDIEIVQSELILRDIESVNSKLVDLKKKARAGMDKELEMQIGVLERLQAWLDEGKPAVQLEMSSDEKNFIHDIWLLSAKKRMFVMNIREGTDESKRIEWIEDLKAFTGDDSEFILQIDVKSLGDMVGMTDEEKEEYIELLGSKPMLSEDIINTAFKRLNLITFYTGSEKEVNSWSIEDGTNAKAAAGVIHSDLSDGFITADVISVEKLVELGRFSDAKEAGAVKNQGKEYIVQNGDYIIVHHS